MTHATHVAVAETESLLHPADTPELVGFYPFCICGWRGHWTSTERDAQDQALLHLQGAT